MDADPTAPEPPTSAPPPPGGRSPGSGSVPTAQQRHELVDQAARDIAEVPAVELISTAALHLMSAAAVKVGLAADEEEHHYRDLAEARVLITALAGLVTASASALGSFHAAPIRDGLTTLQRAFREASEFPDPPGEGPGEKWTGPVY